MKVEVIKDGEPLELMACSLGLGELGIITNEIGLVRPGDPVIRGMSELIFPRIRKWGSLGGGYCCRRLLPGEKVIFTGE